MSEVTNKISHEPNHPQAEKPLEASPEKTAAPTPTEAKVGGEVTSGEAKGTQKASEATDAVSPAESAAAPKSPSPLAQPNKKEIPPAPETKTRLGARLDDPELQLSHFHVARVLKRVLLVGVVTLALVVGVELFIRSVLLPAGVIHRAVSQQSR